MSPVRVLDDRWRSEALEILDADPVGNVFVSSRVHAVGLDPNRLGAKVWGFFDDGRLCSLCYSGANLVPVSATPRAVDGFATAARDEGRRCSSIVGRVSVVSRMWQTLRPNWGPPRAIRGSQPVMAVSSPSGVLPDPLVRRSTMSDFDIVYPACVAMFTEEVGIAPDGNDGGSLYRSRVSELIRTGRSFVRVEDGKVVFKAEVGAVTPLACQIQGVWVRPECRGNRLSEYGMAAVVAEALRSIAPTVTLYVNDFNAAARASYRRVGFADVDRFMSILF
jgi:hypothetical protein